MDLKKEGVDLTAGNLGAGIWHLSWPMLLIMLFNFFVGLTDVYVAGFIGPDIQAVVGFVAQLYIFITIVGNAISIGTLALVARAAGAGQRNRAVRIARESILFSLLMAAVLSALGFFFSREIVMLVGFPPGIRGTAGKFLRIFALALAPNYILIISNAIFRATGEVRKPLITMAVVSAINIAGDFLLVFGIPPFPKMGYPGIAAATAVSVAAGMGVNLSFFRFGRWRSFYRRPWELSLKTAGRILRLGWPAGMIQVVWNAGYIVLYNILGRLGAASITSLAALTNGLRIEAVIYLPAFALNMAASVLLGQNLGAGNPARAERAGWRVAQAGVVLVSIMALIIFTWASRFAGIVARSPDVLRETALYLRISMVSEPFMALSSILGGGLQGAGDARGAMWVIVVSMWLIRLPLAYILAISLGLGAVGVWSAMVFSMVFQGIFMALKFRRGRWKALKFDA